MILVRHANRLAATVTKIGIVFAPHIDVLEADHPIRRWVTCMAAFGNEILNGRLDGPYTPERAAHFARTALIPDQEFAVVNDVDDALLAEHFNVPIFQMAEKRTDLMVRAVGASRPMF